MCHLSLAIAPCTVSFTVTGPLLPFQNMLFEIEQKVSYLSELSVHSESLLLEGRAETKGEAEQLTLKLHSLKDSLMELQQMLQDKQVDIQVRSGGFTNPLPTHGFPFPSLLSVIFVVLCSIMGQFLSESMVVLCK